MLLSVAQHVGFREVELACVTRATAVVDHMLVDIFIAQKLHAASFDVG